MSSSYSSFFSLLPHVISSYLISLLLFSSLCFSSYLFFFLIPLTLFSPIIFYFFSFSSFFLAGVNQVAVPVVYDVVTFPLINFTFVRAPINKVRYVRTVRSCCTVINPNSTFISCTYILNCCIQ